jgi:predicted HicB family RNase H-like nuclease
LPIQDKTTKYVGVRVPLRLAARLEAMARAENNGLSSVVRRLLTTAVNNETARQVLPAKASR